MGFLSSSAMPKKRSALLWLNAQAWTLRRLSSLQRTRTASHLETGSLGEREALFYLRRNGYTIVARRWRSSKFRGDIDLIAWHGDILCFIEVKTRSHHDAFAAEFAVDHDKQRVLRRLARVYLNRLPPDTRRATSRFDVLSVYLAAQPSGTFEFVLNQGAFEWA